LLLIIRSYQFFLSFSSYPHMPIGKVWIYRLLFVCFLFVYTVSDFSAEDKASGVKFCKVVHRRPRQGISHFGELCSPEAQNRLIGQHVKDDNCSSWRLHSVPVKFALRVDVGSACVDIRQSPKMDVVVFLWFCMCVFVRLRISPPRIKLAASNFTGWFIGVQGRESDILGNFATQKPKIGRRIGQHVHWTINST